MNAIKTWTWEVTGLGPSTVPGEPPKNKRGQWTGYKRVTVEADTKDEAIEKAKAILPADKQNEIEAVKRAIVFKS